MNGCFLAEHGVQRNAGVKLAAHVHQAKQNFTWPVRNAPHQDSVRLFREGWSPEVPATSAQRGTQGTAILLFRRLFSPRPAARSTTRCSPWARAGATPTHRYTKNVGPGIRREEVASLSPLLYCFKAENLARHCLPDKNPWQVAVEVRKLYGSSNPPAIMDRRTSFECMFVPKSVAVIGATDREGSVGRTLLHNLLNAEFHGPIYAINPKRENVLGLHCYKDIGRVPDPIDLAVIVTPAPSVPGLIGECVKAGVRSAVVISAGFKEHGAEGTALEREIQAQLRPGKMRVMGPNCLGIMNPLAGLNATFAHDMALPGNVAFLSQSGALETAILDWSLEKKVGFSAIVSTGSMLDVGWAELIDYFGSDPDTRSILLYMESVGDARSFLSSAREVALRKPIILIKAGRSEAAAKAATSHTGALTGSDEVFDAALRRCGVLRVQSISDLFYMAETLARQPRPRGPRLTIVTNAGGPGVLATDALIANGGELAPLSDSSLEALSEFLSPHWSHGNPIDVLGDAGAQEYGARFRHCHPRSEQRRYSCDSRAAGNDRSRRHRRSTQALCPRLRKTGDCQLDGRKARGGGRCGP